MLTHYNLFNHLPLVYHIILPGFISIINNATVNIFIYLRILEVELLDQSVKNV